MEIVTVSRIRAWVQQQFARAALRKEIISSIAVVPSLSLDSGDQIDRPEAWIQNGLVRLQYCDPNGMIHNSKEYYSQREALMHQSEFVDAILRRIGWLESRSPSFEPK